jgi:hypothetical protein
VREAAEAGDVVLPVDEERAAFRGVGGGAELGESCGEARREDRVVMG